MRNIVISLSILLAGSAIPVAAQTQTQAPLVPFEVNCSTTDAATLRATKIYYDKAVAAAASGDALAGRRLMKESLADTIHVTHLPRVNPNVNSGRGEAVWTRNELATVNQMEADAGFGSPPPGAQRVGQSFTSIDGNCVINSSVSRGRNQNGEETLSLNLVINEINKDGKIVAITHYMPRTGDIVARPPTELALRIRAFLNDPKGSVVDGILHRDLAGRK